jgi:DNA polymerase V
MAEKNRIYIAIDLKSFYASVECVERGLDPLTTNLVVADASRTEKTICLAVSPSLKAYGIPGRARLFEVVQKVKEVNAGRQRKAPGHKLTGESYDAPLLASSPELAVSYITAPPQMAHYMECSTRIYQIYLKYVAPEDIHVYSIDEVFIDATDYLKTYKLTPREMTMMLVQDVLKATGVTATAGIGTNLYLAKIAMDIQAKHTAPDKDGVRMAELDEMSYRDLLWMHTPLRDFWRVGKGISAKLEANRMFTMGDIALRSTYDETIFYKLFGINAELLIDHAWGWEPCTIAQIKAYKPSTNSISSGQVLQCPYTNEKAKLIVREMIDLLVLDLVGKGLVTDQMVLDVGYDVKNLTNANISGFYKGEVTTDYYGRKIPKQAHGTANIGRQTSSTMLIMNAVMELFDRIVDKNLLVRRIHVTACHLVNGDSVQKADSFEQLDLFTDYEAVQKKRAEEETTLEREKRIQQAIITLREKYGKNAVLKGMNLEEGATTISRNKQIGGHKA